MSSFQRGPITLEAASALEMYRRVRFNGTQYAYAAAGQNHDFITDAPRANAQADETIGYHRSFDGVVKVTASGAISAGALVYGDASGKVTATQKGGAIGVALTAATTDGDVIEMSPTGGNAEVYEHTHTITAGEDTANTVVIDTGFGTNPTWMSVVIEASGVLAFPSGAITPTAGSLSIATNAAAGAKVHVRAVRAAVTS